MFNGRPRLLVATASTLLGLALALVLWKNRPAHSSLAMIDNRAEVAQILERRVRVRDAESGPDSPEEASAIPGIDDELVREPLSEATARSMFASLRNGGSQLIYDPQAYYWHAPNLDRTKHVAEHPRGSWQIRTNALGFRESVEVLDQVPDWRILVTGDSHTAGIVPGEEMFANLVEAELGQLFSPTTFEALNGGKGGYSFYNYLGVLEKHLQLEPKIFVLTAFGGNDFAGCVNTFRYFNRLRIPPPTREFNEKSWKRLRRKHTSLVGQDLNQIISFASRPGDIWLAEVAVSQVLTKILELCSSHGISFVYIYIPPCSDVQPHLVSGGVEEIVAIMKLSSAEQNATDGLADRTLDFLRDRGVATIDMRPTFRASSEPCYWLSDLHINTRGHRLIANELTDELRELVGQ